MLSNIKGFGLFKYKWLLQELITRDLKIKYRRSVLGYFWSVLNPLLMMAVLTVVFSSFFRFDIKNYPVYLLTGQLLFSFFSEATNMAMSSILMGASLIKKVYLPKYIFPVSRVFSCFTTMIFSLIALCIVMIVTGAEFYLTIILLPIVLAYFLLFSIGISLVLSVMVIFFRDVQYLYGVFLTALTYLTPIFYPLSILPETVKTYMAFNPMYIYIELFRKIMMYGQWPTVEEHAVCLIIAIVSLAIGVNVFNKHQDDFILYI
ncbi:MAG: ABC transporter permease [Phascolarctobacterium sp.]|nr:ABC transporter permease [Phascolarctobacterium sp.]